MMRVQIQLPDELYQRAKALAAQRELSLAEITLGISPDFCFPLARSRC